MFQGIKHLTRYLASLPHLPTMYPCVLDVTTTHELRQEVSPGDLHSRNVPNILISFAYGGEVRAFNEKCAIAYVVLYIFEFFIHWSSKTQPPSTDHSTNYEVLKFYFDTKVL